MVKHAPGAMAGGAGVWAPASPKSEIAHASTFRKRRIPNYTAGWSCAEPQVVIVLAHQEVDLWLTVRDATS